MALRGIYFPIIFNRMLPINELVHASSTFYDLRFLVVLLVVWDNDQQEWQGAGMSGGQVGVCNLSCNFGWPWLRCH